MSLTAYAERFEEIEAGMPPAERARRRAWLRDFLDRGFPDRSLEPWHYTDLSALNDREFGLARASTVPVHLPVLPGTDRLMFVNGRIDPGTPPPAAALLARTTPEHPPSSTDAVAQLNAAFASGGLDLRVPAGQPLARPLHLVIGSGGDPSPSMTHQRHRIALEAGAEAQVFVELIGDGAPERLATQFFDIELAAGARLHWVRVQRETSGSTLLARSTVTLARGARFEAVLIDAGTGLARHELDVRLGAPGAETEVHALCMPREKAHADTQVRLVHAAEQGRSRLGFRGIVDDRAKAIFNGHVVVEPGAQKTDSEQRIASLLLSPRAEINAKPDLEIYADDVKCAHGATVGQLDAPALGYLRSRGIDEATARAMLLRAFALGALEPIRFEPLRQHVEHLLGFPPDEALLETAA